MSRPFFHYHAGALAVDRRNPWQVCSEHGVLLARLPVEAQAAEAVGALTADLLAGRLPGRLDLWDRKALLAPRPWMPEAMRRFPLHAGKYPVFYTVGRDPDGKPLFKFQDRARQHECSHKNLCHLCGLRMAAPYWFLVGAAEFGARKVVSNGPVHEECARYACEACPFLSTPGYVGRTDPRDFVGAAGQTQMENLSVLPGPNRRPRRLCLCSAAAYTSDLAGQYPVWRVPAWASADWDYLPTEGD